MRLDCYLRHSLPHGHLWQKRSAHFHIENAHLYEASPYINLNPLCDLQPRKAEQKPNCPVRCLHTNPLVY